MSGAVPGAAPRGPWRLAALVGLAVGLLLVALSLTGGLAGIEAWAAGQQRLAQDLMAGALRDLRAGRPGAVAGLLAVCFGYGFAHAVGPGHGKLVIGSYGFGSQVPLARLAGLSVAASLAQAGMAVLLVGGGISILDLSRQTLTRISEEQMAQVGTALIAALGLWLALRGWRMLAAAGRAPQVRAPQVRAGHRHDRGDHAPAQAAAQVHRHDHARAHGQADAHTHANVGGGPRSSADPRGDAGSHDLGQGAYRIQAHAHEHQQIAPHHHAPACGCGHAHGPTPDQIARTRSLRDAALVIGAIALRPCTGALFLLILTWRMQIFGMGVLGAVAMGLGTASVTLAVAALSVWARQGSLALMPRSGPWAQAARWLPGAMQMGAGALIAAVALAMLV